MITKGEKFVISFVLLLVLILNFSVPFVYAIEKAAEKIEPVQYCNLFAILALQWLTWQKTAKMSLALII